MPESKNDRTLLLRLPSRQHRELKRYARQHRLSMAEVVRRSVSETIKEAS